MKRIEEIPARARKPYVRWTEADTFGALGLPDRAEQVLLACIDRDRRGRHKGLLRLVKLAYRQGRFQEAAKWAEQGDRFHRDSYTTPYADGLFWWAACCLQLGNVDRARELERDLSAHRPRYPWLAKLRQAIARFE
jgi:tetratricopeptide (TPR) repeat protein